MCYNNSTRVGGYIFPDMFFFVCVCLSVQQTHKKVLCRPLKVLIGIYMVRAPSPH